MSVCVIFSLSALFVCFIFYTFFSRPYPIQTEYSGFGIEVVWFDSICVRFCFCVLGKRSVLCVRELKQQMMKKKKKLNTQQRHEFSLDCM